MSGAKIIARKPKIGKNFLLTNANPGNITPMLYMAITHHQLELESCSSL